MLNDIKSEVLLLIQATDNEQLLELIKADIEFFSASESDNIHDLLPEEIEELRNLSGEPDNKEAISEEEFLKATAKWRIK